MGRVIRDLPPDRDSARKCMKEMIRQKTRFDSLIVLRGEAELVVNSSSAGTLYACDVTGRRLFTIPAKVEENRTRYLLKTDSGQGPVLAYELIR